MTKLEKFIIAAIILYILIAIYGIATGWQKCEEAGGVYVRGVLQYECIGVKK